MSGTGGSDPFRGGQYDVEPYPYSETTDLRSGPDLHPALLGLLPYVGVWRGRGQGGYPTIKDFEYGQEVRFSHDGRPFLYYESRSWLLDADGEAVRPTGREVGWWRPAPDDSLEVLLSHPTGIMELYVGQIDGTKVEIATDAVLRTSTAKEVASGHRLYGIVEGALMYAYDMGAVGQHRQPHLSARLERVAG
ncbi:MAG: FABP family protein [Micromonosporaceae bacterium]